MALDFGRDLIVRWRDPEPAHVELLKLAGIQGVLLGAPHEEFERACKGAAIQVEPESNLKTIALANLPADPGAYAALADGLWPGISRGATHGSADEIASASNEPWVDANSFRVAYLRALYPKAAPVLAYEANAKARLAPDRIVPHSSVELALVEARVMGGNYILSLPPAFREALVKGDDKAVSAWKEIGKTAGYLTASRQHFSGTVLPAITCLVEPGRQTHEIANLMYRRNASPDLVTPASLGAPSKDDIRTIVTTGLRAPSPEVVKRLMAHAEQGASIVTDDVTPNAWWRAAATNPVKKQIDRVFYAVGKGAIVAYNRRVVDPSEHSLDVIDIVTHPLRAVRVWNGPSIVAIASHGGVLHLLNYSDSGRNSRREIQVRMQGRYSKAKILRPEDTPKPLEVKHRGTTTEIFVQEIRQTATVVFSV